MIVETDNLWKKFGRFDALQGLSLGVPEGSALALIGPNGAGKTTTLKLLMNMIAPTKGCASVLGVDSRVLSPRELAQIGYVSENQEMPGRMTVAQYIAYLRPFYPNWDRSLEAQILGRFRLPPERRIKDLSHGMRMKMALACALTFRPRLLVLDEPFSGLDSLVRDEFLESLVEQAGEMTILISSHELAEIEGLATDVAFLDQGKLLFQQSMDDLTERWRQVRVTLESEARAPAGAPCEWLDLRAEGNVLSFVDTKFREGELAGRIDTVIGPVRHIEAQAIPLRAIFTTLARSVREDRP